MTQPQQPELSARKITLSYEVLYEKVRQEKVKSELQPLDPHFIGDLQQYLREKEASYTSAASKDDFFSINEREKLQQQVHNIRRLIKELYERREKKIVEMALNRTKLTQDLVDTTHLMDHERILYEQFVALLGQGRSQGIFGILTGGKTLDYGLAPSLSSIPSAPSEAVVTPEPLSEPVVGATDAPQEPSVVSNGTRKSVRFLTFTPPFVDAMLEQYGPYEENQTAELPTDIAEVLISQGSAVELPQ